jgi:hypothetical protein
MSAREVPGGKRFAVLANDETLLTTDDWQQVLEFVR